MDRTNTVFLVAGILFLPVDHQARLNALKEYNRRRDLYYQGKISRAEVLEAAKKAAETTIGSDVRAQSFLPPGVPDE